MSNPVNSTININVNVVTEGDKITVICDPEQAVVQDPNSLIIFALTNSDYQFPTENAIVFQHPGSEFPNTWYMAPSYVGVRDRRLTTGLYAYTVTVQHAETGVQHSVDPYIKNGNE